MILSVLFIELLIVLYVNHNVSMDMEYPKKRIHFVGEKRNLYIS